MTTYDHDVQETTWVSPPSETILRLIYQKKTNLNRFRLETGFSVEQFMDLLHDKVKVSSRLASVLSGFLGGSQAFWMNRYELFNNQLEESNKITISENYHFLTNLSDLRQTSIEGLLNSFRVSTFEHLIMDYLHSPKIMYSKSQKAEASPVNIASWIRNCELVGERTVISELVNTFDPAALQATLGEVIALSKVNSVNKVIDRLKSILIEAGVVLVLSPSEVGNGVSGFTKSLLKRYRLVVVTDRYKNNAAFWFTLLHELAHCVLHSISQPLVHYSDHEFTLASLPTNNIFEEEEANAYVEELLFNRGLMKELERSSKSYRNIMRLAVKYDISTALIVAQIHRAKLAPYSHYRKVYKEVKFNEIY